MEPLLNGGEGISVFRRNSYNLFIREIDLLEYCLNHCVGVLHYFSLKLFLEMLSYCFVADEASMVLKYVDSLSQHHTHLSPHPLSFLVSQSLFSLAA